MKVSIALDPGRHRRHDCPMEVRLPDGAPDGTWALNPGNIPAQSIAGRLMFILPVMNQSVPITFTATPAPAPARVTVTEGPDTLAFADDGRPVTSYHFGPQSPMPVPARPYFFPILLDGQEMTRAVTPKAAPQPEIDHPHHKGLYVAFGSVNGTNLWDDGNDHGFQRHVKFGKLVSGPACAAFEETVRWESKEGAHLLDEIRYFRLWRAVDGGRLLDLTVIFMAKDKPVTFGDTKEGGICSVRVPEPLQGDAGGVITNAQGGVGESECWGHRSPWVDYSGTLDGKKVGVAILDHPRGFRFPTNWHVRDYGLFTANPFGWHDFQTGWSQDGSHVLPAGGMLPFHYRVFFHAGDALDARVAARWLDFAHPPKAEVKPA